MSNNAAVVSCRSIRRRNKEERWNLDLLLGILGNPWTLARRTRSQPRSAVRYIPMVNPEVEVGLTVAKTRNEEIGKRTYIAMRATLGCKGCSVGIHLLMTHRANQVRDESECMQH